MGSVIRQSIVSTVISYAGVVIGYVNLLILYPRFMEPEEIGLLRTIQDAAILFTPFAQFGLVSGIYRYYPQMALDKESAGRFISLILVLSLVGFTLFFVGFKVFETTLLGYFESNAGELIEYASLVLWFTLILLITTLLEAYSRSLLKMVMPQLLREIILRLLLAGLVFAYFTGLLTFDQFIVSSVLAYLLCLSVLIAYLASSGDLKFSASFYTVEREKLPGLVRYSLVSFAGMAGMIIISKIDSLMVSAMIGLAANAVYTTAGYMATVIEIPKRTLSLVTTPHLARAFEKNDKAEILSLYSKSALNQLAVGVLLLVGVWANIGNIFDLMPRGDIYREGSTVLVFIGLGKLIDMAFGPSSEIIGLSKHYWFNIVLVALLSVAVIVLNNFFIPMYGIDGAAYSFIAVIALFNILKFIFIYVTLGLQPFSASGLKVLVAGALGAAAHLALPSLPHPLADVLVRSSLITMVFGGVILLWRVSPEITGIVNGRLEDLGLRLRF
jgi:O-antigen/teichoic acid export membrane protein